MIVPVYYDYLINWNATKKAVEIEGPYSRTDYKLNELIGEPMYFDGSKFYDDSCEWDEQCIDNKVIEAANICWKECSSEGT